LDIDLRFLCFSPSRDHLQPASDASLLRRRTGRAARRAWDCHRCSICTSAAARSFPDRKSCRSTEHWPVPESCHTRTLSIDRRHHSNTVDDLW